MHGTGGRAGLGSAYTAGHRGRWTGCSGCDKSVEVRGTFKFFLTPYCACRLCNSSGMCTEIVVPVAPDFTLTVPPNTAARSRML